MFEYDIAWRESLEKTETYEDLKKNCSRLDLESDSSHPVKNTGFSPSTIPFSGARIPNESLQKFEIRAMMEFAHETMPP